MSRQGLANVSLDKGALVWLALVEGLECVERLECEKEEERMVNTQEQATVTNNTMEYCCWNYAAMSEKGV